MTITDFGTATFPAGAPSPELLRAPAVTADDELLELMGGSIGLSREEALRVLACNGTWDDGATFPAWSPSPELLRAPADSCDKLLEHMSNDMSYTEALQALRSNDTTDWDDDGASGVDVLVVGFLFTLALIAAVTVFISSLAGA